MKTKTILNVNCNGDHSTIQFLKFDILGMRLQHTRDTTTLSTYQGQDTRFHEFGRKHRRPDSNVKPYRIAQLDKKGQNIISRQGGEPPRHTDIHN